jgi:protein O-GlcNAc transferase
MDVRLSEVNRRRKVCRENGTSVTISTGYVIKGWLDAYAMAAAGGSCVSQSQRLVLMHMIASQMHAAAAIRNAFELARQGQLQHAEEICGEILRHQADHAEAWLLRGVIEVQTGRTADAAASIRRSIQSNPARAAAHSLLGDALLNLSRPDAALESYETALRLDSRLVSAHCGRANALLDLQRPREALLSYDQVLQFRPNDSEAQFNRGNALFQLHELNLALESYERALALNPSHAATHGNRGAVMMRLRRPEAALESFEAALAIAPDLPEGQYRRGCALRELRSWPQALDAFDRALNAQSQHVESHIGRGEALRELKRPADAVDAFDRALQLRPDCVAALRGRGDALLDLGRPADALTAHDAALRLGTELADTFNSRGNSLRALKRFPEAIAAYDESLRLDPHNSTVHYNRGTAFLRWGDHSDQALASYSHVLQLKPDLAYVAGSVFDLQRNRGDWSVIAPPASREGIVESVLADRPVIAPFAFLSVTDSAAAQLRCATRFAADHCASDSRQHRGGYGHERIRLAYVSADLREHAVTYLMTGVLEKHDRRRFETVGISLRPAEASVPGERIKNAFGRFVDASTLTDSGVADLMREMEIDIAVDLGGFTDGFRSQIFNHRAAPVQVNYLGFPGTMGTPCMDYLIADDFVIPAGRQQYYREHIVYLPHCFQANDDQRVISDRPTSREEQGLPKDAFVFCCLNNSHKINPTMFDIWMRLLSGIQGSVLWLLGEDAAVRENLRREAGSRGVAAERLIFALRAPYSEHLARLKLADLFLDTLPFNAGATASDVLWAGLPLLTCAGEAFAARMGGSLLRAVNLPELITFDLAHYESKAAELARNPPSLAELRHRLAQHRLRAPLFDTDLLRRHLEAAYAEMWLRSEGGREPAAFSVPAAALESVSRNSGPTNGA